MLQSLRFRLPALFLAGVLLAGIVSAAIAFRLLQSYSEDQSLKELRREAGGLTSLYAQQAIKSSDEGGIAPAFVGAELENATGDRIYYAGLPLFPGETAGLRRLPSGLIDWPAIRAGQSVTFEFTPPDEDRPYIAVGSPVALEGTTFGALVVAKPKTVLRDTWLTLMKFFAVSLLGGLVVAAGVAWWASRRITRPVLTLSRAADEIAEGRYDVAVPQLKGGDEISHLAQRFSDMAARLAEAEELERNFLMSVSHELRTPLTAIRGHLEAVREGVVHEPEAQAESLDVIAAETDRLERLVGDVLDLAKLDARRFTVLREEVDMGRLLDQAYASFGEEARRRGIEYRCLANERPVITTDGDRVLQIISNLLANAFRWTPDGGTIELALDAENGDVSVAVADSGPGIKRDEQERIFRPFWSQDGGGTGLGLTIARELAMALGGRIELASTTGEGSRFALVLPATPAALALCVGAAVAQAVHRRLARAERLLDAREPLVDGLPAGADEVHEQAEVVDASVPLGGEVGLEALEPPQQLDRHPAHLRDLPSHRSRFAADAVANRVDDLRGQGRGEPVGGRGQLDELKVRPLEDGAHVGGVRTRCRRLQRAAPAHVPSRFLAWRVTITPRSDGLEAGWGTG